MPCPECQGNFFAPILNSLRDPANKEWLSKNLSARSIDKGASAIGQGVVNGINSIAKGFRSLFGGGHRSSGPPPNMASNVNINTLRYYPINSNFPNGLNEIGLNHQQWANLPWQQRMFSSDPTLNIVGGSGALGFVSGGGAMKFVQYSGEALNLLKSTEFAAQSETAIAEIMSKMKAGDMSIYSKPIYTYIYEGERYILNGHHRVQAAIRLGEKIEAIELSGMKIYSEFSKEMEEIWAGLHL